MTSLVLYHHPFSRAASVVWMLEELGLPYRLEYVDFAQRAQKSDSVLALNPMGKIPILVDGETVVTESAAIALYLADRYALGRLAPALDAPERAKYLHAVVFPSVVMEPASLARLKGWEVPAGQAGFGDFASMSATLEKIVGDGPYVLGNWFTMADAVLGSSLRYMMAFKMIDATPRLTAYVARLIERPALQAANAVNSAVVADRGLERRS